MLNLQGGGFWVESECALYEKPYLELPKLPSHIRKYFTRQAIFANFPNKYYKILSTTTVSKGIPIGKCYIWMDIWNQRM